MINILNVPAEQILGKIIFQAVILFICILVLTRVTNIIKINERTFVWGVLILMAIFIIKNIYLLLK